MAHSISHILGHIIRIWCYELLCFLVYFMICTIPATQWYYDKLYAARDVMFTTIIVYYYTVHILVLKWLFL